MNNMGKFIEVELIKDFSIVIETLERIGICNRHKKILTPSCYIIRAQGKYFICHFKELLARDGYRRNITASDYTRRNKIATMLENWGLVKIKNRDFVESDESVKIFVLKHKDKGAGYKISHKYSIRQYPS